MEQWEQERNAVLTWWPTILAGRKPPGHMFVAGLEDEAWACSRAEEWDQWLTKTHRIWPQGLDDLGLLALGGRRPWDDQPGGQSPINDFPRDGAPPGAEGTYGELESGTPPGGDIGNADGYRDLTDSLLGTRQMAQRQGRNDTTGNDTTGNRGRLGHQTEGTSSSRDEVEEETAANRGIDSHLGPTLGQAVRAKIAHRDQIMPLPHPDLVASANLEHQPTKPKPGRSPGPGIPGSLRGPSGGSGNPAVGRAVARPSASTPSAEVGRQAQQLQNEFALAEIAVAHTTSGAWIQKQLTDARMGLSQMTLAWGILPNQIGRGRLRLWFHEASIHKGAILGRADHLEIHGQGGNVAQTWAWWRLRQAVSSGRTDQSVLEAQWRRSWQRGARVDMERQLLILEASQGALKGAVDRIDISSDMGERAFRRYRAACKWFDLVRSGASLAVVRRGWTKVRMGNRIAWAGFDSPEAIRLARAWAWEEQLIESAFFGEQEYMAGVGTPPSWVRRVQAITLDRWSDDLELGPDDVLAVWALGLEALLRSSIGFDNWAASRNGCQPMGEEEHEFRAFAQEHLRPILFG